MESVWILGRRWYLPALAAIYLVLHVAVRQAVSPSLDFDESELVFLTQWFVPGYNNQPPLFNWLQRAVFQVLGCSIFSLSLLKNLLIVGTYGLIFLAIRTATGNPRAAVVASVGMLTIPQISWESHRDLSHTVGLTFFVALLIYGVVRLERQSARTWYLLIGAAVGCSILSKYNAVVLVAGLLIAGLSIPAYRRLILDRRILLSLGIAGLILAPHTIWMFHHLALVSTRTIARMTENGQVSYLGGVLSGLAELASSLFGCLALTLVVFLAVRWPVAIAESGTNLSSKAMSEGEEECSLGLLLERLLIVIGLALLLMVLGGQINEFKNRWLQPFVFFVPAYLVLRWPALSRPRVVNRLSAVGGVVILAVLVAILCRPFLSRDGGKPNRLNLDYDYLAVSLGMKTDLVIASDMRVAGNLRMQFPRTTILSLDHPHLRFRRSVGESTVADKVLIVSDSPPEQLRSTLRASRDLIHNDRRSRTPETSFVWRRIEVPYLHKGETFEFAAFYVGRWASPVDQVRQTLPQAGCRRTGRPRGDRCDQRNRYGQSGKGNRRSQTAI